MRYINAMPEHRVVMLAAVSAGLIPDTFPARSRLMNDIKRNADTMREVAAKVAATALPPAVALMWRRQ